MTKYLVILSAGILCVCSVPVRASQGDAVAAQKKLVIDSIAKSDIVTAEAACWQLVNAPTPHALHEIVDEADTLNKLPEVRQVFQDMITALPKDPQVIWLKTGLAIADIHLGNDAAAQATLQDIIGKHGSDDRVVEALGQIAWAYRKLQKYDKALSSNQYTVDNWPQKDRAAYAQQGIVLCQIGLGDISAADKALDVLIQKFSRDPDASKIVLWSAFGYDDAGKKDRAYDVYGLVVQSYPNTPEAVTAQARRALASMDAEDPTRMAQDIPTLLTQFAVTQDKGEAVRYLENGLFWKRFGYANQPTKQDIVTLVDGYLETVAKHTVAVWPKTNWALWAERDLGTVAIQRGDDAAAQAAVDSLTADYANSTDTPAALTFLADQAFGLKKFAEADQIYQRICDHWPGGRQALLASAGHAKSCIAQGQDDQGDAIFRKMFVDYADEPSLPEVSVDVAQAYYVRGIGQLAEFRKDMTTTSRQGQTKQVTPDSFRQDIGKAIAVWEMVGFQMPESPTITPRAVYHAAVCSAQDLGDYEKGIRYFKIVVEKWPSYKYASNAQRFIAFYTEKSAKLAGSLQPGVEIEIEQIYKGVMEKYPDSNEATVAALRLGQLRLNDSKWLEAASLLERFLERANATQWARLRTNAIYGLATAYERTGKTEAAIELYRMFATMTDPEDSRVQALKARFNTLPGDRP
jgi:tetratricopeptide (TPR) repeat protein